jgi:biopolymer transport protein ExbD
MYNFPTKPKKKSRIEIIPMIDVMMFLLVFFVLIGLNVLPNAGLHLNLPTSSTTKPIAMPTRIVIGVPVKGAYQIDGEDVQELSGIANFIQLRKQNSSSPVSIIIKGDQDTPVQRLVDVMDILKSNGISEITISAKKKA